MNSRYSDFLQKNPTFQDRIEAFTSGLLAPDPKPVVLWSMEPQVSYTVGELHRRVKKFVHGPLPVSCLRLDAAWTKNRRKGFQPLPTKLVKRLAACTDSGVVSQLYQRFFSSFAYPERALLYVPSHPARELDEDLQAARIPKQTKEGKLDLAAPRNSYVTLAAEAGANVKELETLARHSTPDLTLNVYAKKRDERLAELAEKIGESVFFEPECAPQAFSVCRDQT